MAREANYEQDLQMVRDVLKAEHLTICEIKSIDRIIYNHIMTHKWFINETIPFKVNIEDAIFSWEVNVYEPLMNAINKSGILNYFKGVSKVDLFRKISDHMYYVRVEDPIKAVESYAKLFIKSKWKRLAFFFTKSLIN